MKMCAYKIDQEDNNLNGWGVSRLDQEPKGVRGGRRRNDDHQGKYSDNETWS